MKIVFYGLTLTSSWGNGHATTYRSLVKALARIGHEVHFVEKDVEWYRSNRDLPQPDFCALHLYDTWEASAQRMLAIARDADVVVIGSYYPDAIAATRRLLQTVQAPLLFYDIDTPVTLTQLRQRGRADYLEAASIPHYAAYLSFSGGPVLQELESSFGSPRAVPFYCSVDPDSYKPSQVSSLFACDLSYLGTYSADRQEALTRYLCGAAPLIPAGRFLVAGAQYPAEIIWPANVRRMAHVAPQDHASFYSSSRFTLNLTRSDMKAAGYSPSVRLFEAAACGAVIVSDAWSGLEQFMTPGEEILVPASEYELADILQSVTNTERRRFGDKARERILAEHTAAIRAAQFEHIVAECYSAASMTEANRA